MPVKLVMRGAINEDLGVIGAIVVDVSTTTTDSRVRSTRLLCYVSSFLMQGSTHLARGNAIDFLSPNTMASNDYT